MTQFLKGFDLCYNSKDASSAGVLIGVSKGRGWTITKRWTFGGNGIGHLVACLMERGGTKVCLVNVYLDTSSSDIKIKQSNFISKWWNLSYQSDWEVILGGDFNWIEDPEDRIDLASGTPSVICGVANRNAWVSLLATLALDEVYQSAMTYLDRGGRSMSRPDRFYIRFRDASLANADTTCLCPPFAPDISDHRPINFVYKVMPWVAPALGPIVLLLLGFSGAMRGFTRFYVSMRFVRKQVRKIIHGKILID